MVHVCVVESIREFNRFRYLGMKKNEQKIKYIR